MNPDLKFLIDRAFVDSDRLSVADRCRLLRAVVAICPADSPEADHATHTLFHFEHAEMEQLRFRELLIS